VRATEVTRVCPPSCCSLVLFHISQGIGVCGTGSKPHLEIPPQPKGGVLTRVFRRFRRNRPKTIFRASWRVGVWLDLTLFDASKIRNFAGFVGGSFGSAQRISTSLAEKLETGGVFESRLEIGVTKRPRKCGSGAESNTFTLSSLGGSIDLAR
jgi:hypothetical protein